MYNPYLDIVSKFPPEILRPGYEFSFAVIVHHKAQPFFDVHFNLRENDVGIKGLKFTQKESRKTMAVFLFQWPKSMVEEK